MMSQSGHWVEQVLVRRSLTSHRRRTCEPPRQLFRGRLCHGPGSRPARRPRDPWCLSVRSNPGRAENGDLVVAVSWASVLEQMLPGWSPSPPSWSPSGSGLCSCLMRSRTSTGPHRLRCRSPRFCLDSGGMGW